MSMRSILFTFKSLPFKAYAVKYAIVLTVRTMIGNVIHVSSRRLKTFFKMKYSIGPISNVYITMNRATHPNEMTGTPANVSMCDRRRLANSSSES